MSGAAAGGPAVRKRKDHPPAAGREERDGAGGGGCDGERCPSLWTRFDRLDQEAARRSFDQSIKDLSDSGDEALPTTYEGWAALIKQTKNSFWKPRLETAAQDSHARLAAESGGGAARQHDAAAASAAAAVPAAAGTPIEKKRKRGAGIDEAVLSQSAGASTSAAAPPAREFGEALPLTRNNTLVSVTSGCPLRANKPDTAHDGRLLDGVVHVPQRGLTVRELASVLLVTLQHPDVWPQLGATRPTGLGPSQSLLLKDEAMSRLYEWAFDLESGALGPEGSRIPHYTFRDAMLDVPSPAVTERAQELLTTLMSDMAQLDRQKHHQAAVDRSFRNLFHELLFDAGRSPKQPELLGLIPLGVAPALTEALSAFSVQHGVTVGQSVAEVASVREGHESIIYDGRGERAANAYQPRKPISSLASSELQPPPPPPPVIAAESTAAVAASPEAGGTAAAATGLPPPPPLPPLAALARAGGATGSAGSPLADGSAAVPGGVGGGAAGTANTTPPAATAAAPAATAGGGDGAARGGGDVAADAASVVEPAAEHHGGAAMGIDGADRILTVEERSAHRKAILRQCKNRPGMLELLLRKGTVIHEAILPGSQRLKNQGVDDEIDEAQRQRAAILHSLELFGLTSFDAAKADGNDVGFVRGKWKAMCQQIHPNKIQPWCKTYEFHGSQEEILPLLTDAFSILTKARELVENWLEREGIILGVKIARERPSESDGRKSSSKRSAEQIALDSGTESGPDDSEQSLSRRRKGGNANDNQLAADARCDGAAAAGGGDGAARGGGAVAADAAAVAEPAAKHHGGAALPVSDNGGDGGDLGGKLRRNDTRSWTVLPDSDNGGDGGDGGAAETAHSGFGRLRKGIATALPLVTVDMGASCIGGAKTPSISDGFGGFDREVLSQPVRPTGGSGDAEDGGEAGCHGAFHEPLGGVDGPVGALDYVGRDLLNWFRELFDASGLLRPAIWQETEPQHQCLMLDALQSLHLELEQCDVISQTCLLPISLASWQRFREGPLDQECVAFMVRTLLEALGIPLIGGAGKAACRSKQLMFSRTSSFVAVMIPPDDREQWAISDVERLLSVFSASQQEHREMLVVTKGHELIKAGAAAPASKDQPTRWFLTRQGNKAYIDPQTVIKVESLLKKAGLTKVTVVQDSGEGSRERKETSPFAMFIDLVRCLTGEELAPAHCCLCMELLRYWFDLVLFRTAELNGAISSGWLTAQFEAQIAKLRIKRPETQLSGAADPVSNQKTDTALWKVLTFRSKRSNGNSLRRQKCIGTLNGEICINGSHHPIHVEMYKTEGNDSCWPIAVLRELGVVLMNDSAVQKIQDVLGAKFANFQRWAEYGRRLLLADPKDTKLLSVSEFRQYVFRLLLDNPAKVKTIFSAGPLEGEADLANGIKIAKSEFGPDTNLEAEDPDYCVKAWAFAVLDPKTHMTEQLWQAFLNLEFDNLVALFVITRLQTRQGKRNNGKATNQFFGVSHQPLLGPPGTGSQVVFAVIYELKAPADDEVALEEAADAMLNDGGRGRTRAASAAKKSAESAADDDVPPALSKEELVRILKADAYASADRRGHFQQATILNQAGLPDVLVLAASNTSEPSCDSKRQMEPESSRRRQAGSTPDSTPGVDQESMPLDEAEAVMEEATTGSQDPDYFKTAQPLSESAETAASSPPLRRGAGSAEPPVDSEPISPRTGRTPPGGESSRAKSLKSKKKSEDDDGQAKISTFFLPRGCKPDLNPAPKSTDDGDGGGGNEPVRTLPGASAGADSSSACDSEPPPRSETGGSAPRRRSQQLATAYSLLKQTPKPHSQGLESCLQRSDSTMWPRRKLFAALLNAMKYEQAVERDRRAEAAIQQLIHRTASSLTAACVPEEAMFGPILRAYIRGTFLPAMRQVGITDRMLEPICDGLAGPLHDSQQLKPVPPESLTSSGSAITAMSKIYRTPLMTGPAGLLQKAFGICCLCWAVPGDACPCGFRFCAKCRPRESLSNGSPGCNICLAAAKSLLGRVDVKTVKESMIMHQTAALLDQAAKMLVLAVMLSVDTVVGMLLPVMVEVLEAQLRERVVPSFTADQAAVLFGKDPRITESLLVRVAKAQAAPLRELALFSTPGLNHLDTPEERSARRQQRAGARVAYLAGDLRDAAAYTFLLNKSDGSDGNEVWLICCEPCQTPQAVRLVELFREEQRLIVLDDSLFEMQQAEAVLQKNLDVIILIANPTPKMELILAHRLARYTVNWWGLSGTRADLCDFTMIGSDSDLCIDDPRMIVVDFDQPVKATVAKGDGHSKMKNGKSGTEAQSAQNQSRASVGLPTASFIVMFPGFVFDRFSLWNWLQLVAGLDDSVLALTADSSAEPSCMANKAMEWVKEFADSHSPFDISRVLLLTWQGHAVHAARVRFSDLCVSSLSPKAPPNFVAAVLAEGVGLLVMAGTGTGSADVRAIGLGALLIATSAEDFVKKGIAWASHYREATAFMQRQKMGGLGYFEAGRIHRAVKQVIEAVLAGKQSINIISGARPITTYVDDRTLRLDRILKEIQAGWPLRTVQPFFKTVLGILHHVEGQGIRLEGVAGLGGSCIVLNGTLMRQVAPKFASGEQLDVFIEKSFRNEHCLHNSPVVRNGFNTQMVQDQTRRSKNWNNLFAQPVPILNGGKSFIGYTEPSCQSPNVVAFAIFKNHGGGFEELCTRFADQWCEHATITNDLLTDVLQPLLLGLYHAHRFGFLNRNITPQTIGQNPDGKVVFRGLVQGWFDEPESGGAQFGKKRSAASLMRRNTSHFFPDETGGSNTQGHVNGKTGGSNGETGGSNPQGHANLVKARGQKNRRAPFLYLTRSDFYRAVELSRQRGRGLGRLGDGNLTFCDRDAAKERAEAVKKDPNASEDRAKNEAGDCFEALRLLLQIFNKVDRKDAKGWEERATAATADGDSEKVLEFMKSGTRATPQQPMALGRIAVLIARAMGPREFRPNLIDMMTDRAATLPILPPAEEQKVLEGTGMAFPGGVAGIVYRGIQEKWKKYTIPATSVRREPDGKGGNIGLGVMAVGAIRSKEFCGFYCGTKRSPGDGVDKMDTFPSRFGVSISSKEQTDKFSIDGFMGRKLTLEWLKTHQATGAFMNAGGQSSNVRLDRHKAWTDPLTGIVWIPMYAICNIAAGDFLRWKYDPTAGEGGVYTFNDEVSGFSRG